MKLKSYKKILSQILIGIIILILILIPVYTQAISAQSAIVMEVQTGRILYARNIYNKLPMASTTKIMTALVALEKGNIKSIVKVPREAVGVEGSSIYLRYNEQISLEDLLYGLMLRSGNDAAVAIAYHISGSVEDFVKLMNKRAKEIGAKNTHFKNPHGLHDDNHYTTAYDLALITRTALLNAKFKEIVSTKKWVAKRDGYNLFYNKNKTLSQFKGGDGVKIGYTRAAGRCLVSSATRNGMQLISVVLNDYNWFDDCHRLMEAAFNTYKPYEVLYKDKPIKSFNINKGQKKKSYLVSKKNITIPVSEREKEKVFTVFESNEVYNAPIKKDEVLGKAKIYVGDELIATTELIAKESVKKQSFMDYIIDIFDR